VDAFNAIAKDEDGDNKNNENNDDEPSRNVTCTNALLDVLVEEARGKRSGRRSREDSRDGRDGPSPFGALG